MAVRKFIIKTIFFLLPLIAAYAFIEHKLWQIPNTYNTKKACLEKNADSIEVLVLGTSHALFGINPEYFSHKGFNFSNASQSLDYDKDLVFKYLPELPKLKLVIIPIGYQSLYYRIADVIEYWRGFYYYHFLDIDDRSLPVMDSRRFSLFMLYTPQEAFEIMRKGFNVNYAEKLLCNGYMYPELNLTDGINDSSAAVRIRAHNLLIKYGKHDIIMHDLDTLTKMLTAKNIKVVFITLPVYTTYSSQCDKSILAKSSGEINELCSKYHCGYINYFTNNRFYIKDFNDNDHLSIQGAKKFSLLLDSDVIQKAFN